jgi:hypothetical protein
MTQEVDGDHRQYLGSSLMVKGMFALSLDSSSTIEQKIPVQQQIYATLRQPQQRREMTR